MTEKTNPSPLPTITQDTRERFINAACAGDLTSEELAAKLDMAPDEARDIVDSRLREAMLEVARNKTER